MVGVSTPVLFRAGLVLASIASAVPSGAVTVIQTFNDTNTFTSFVESAASTNQVLQPSPLDFTVQPFQASLGTLNSVTIDWSGSGSASATVGTSAASGSLSFSLGGNLFVAADQYSGFGCGGGSGAGSSGSFNASVTLPCGNSKQFTLAGAGTTNPAIWTTLASGNPYIISFSNSPNLGDITYGNIASGTATMDFTAVVTYDYTPFPAAAAPAPLPLLGAGAALAWSRRLRRRINRQG